MSGDPGLVGVALAAVFVAVSVGLSFWQRLRAEGTLLWASLRAAVQLAVVGVVLVWVLESHIIWSWLWVVAMIVFAADTVRRRARGIRGAFWIAVLAYAASAVVTIGVLFGLGVVETTPRSIVPLAGMMVGNSLNATVLAAKRVVAELADNRGEVEALLCLGFPSGRAAARFVRRAMSTALTPQIETTKAVGVVFLPGAMTGMILAGADPGEAVRLQLVVMYMILSSVMVTTTIVTLGMARRCFSPDQRLIVPAGA